MANNVDLFNALTRHQIYLEGVKANQGNEFNKVLQELDKEFKVLFAELEYETLDGLTKAKLKTFIKSIREVQGTIYNRYTSKLIEDIQAFMAVDLEVLNSIYEENTDEGFIGFALFGTAAFLGTADSNKKLWSLIANAPIPANGVLPKSFISHFATSASNSIENLVRKAYSNKYTKQQLLNEIIGSRSLNYRDGQFSKLLRQSTAVTNTLLQHTSAIINAGLASSYFRSYIWNSVLDGNTTEICIRRNGETYSFENGPLPPAHVGCRSDIWPIAGSANVDLINISYYSWLRSQPEDFQNDILGEDQASKLRSGKLKAKDFSKFVNAKALTIEQFKKKLKLILLTD